MLVHWDYLEIEVHQDSQGNLVNQVGKDLKDLLVLLETLDLKVNRASKEQLDLKDSLVNLGLLDRLEIQDNRVNQGSQAHLEIKVQLVQ